MLARLKNLLSRKFLVVLAGIVLPLIQEKLNAPPGCLKWMYLLLIGYVGAEGAADLAARFK